MVSIIYEKMGDRAEKRQSENTYRIGTFPNLTDIDNRTLLGSFSWFTPVEHIRYLNPNTIVNIGLGDQTQPEIARDYLMAKFGKPPKIRKTQLDELTRVRTAPLFSVPGTYPDMCYIDLKGAYWNIRRIIGWDVDYMPGKWLTFRSDVEDFPAPELKVARSALVSLSQSASLLVWTGRKIISEKTGSNLLNSALWACVFDILHGIASDMLNLGAVYVHTDGYMLPRRRADEAIETVRQWGLLATLKYEGDAEVTTVGVYRIGNRQTLQRAPVVPHAWHKVDNRWTEWLKPRVHFLYKYKVDRQGVNLL